jgi:hypothetical protein
MKSLMAAVLALLLAAAGNSAPAHAAQTFAYRLLPGQSTLRYATLVGDEHREIYGSVSGTFSFVLNADDTITASTFDLTIEGPFYDGTLEAPDSIPFAAGDKLADYLSVDFASALGLTFTLPQFNGQPGPPYAVVGPDAHTDGESVFLGTSYYNIRTLDRDPTEFILEATARDGIEGSFQIFPQTFVTEEVATNTNGLGGILVIPRLVVVPNVALIPEPTSAVLLVAGGLVFGFRRRR